MKYSNICLWLQMMLGLKREHKEKLEEKQKFHDEDMFKIRGEQAVSVEYYVRKIQDLENDIKQLKASGGVLPKKTKMTSVTLNKDDEHQVFALSKILASNFDHSILPKKSREQFKNKIESNYEWGYA